jgi:hypothetical protein
MEKEGFVGQDHQDFFFGTVSAMFLYLLLESMQRVKIGEFFKRSLCPRRREKKTKRSASAITSTQSLWSFGKGLIVGAFFFFFFYHVS